MDFNSFFYGYVSLALKVVAIIHFIRNRPNFYWLWIILIGGWIGPLVYLFMEAVPDWQPRKFDFFSRSRRIRELKSLVIDNPSAGNYEELGDLLLDSGDYRAAREAFTKAIEARNDSLHPYYRRGLCNYELGEFRAAIADLDYVLTKDPKHDFLRGPGLLAHAYHQVGDLQHAEKVFRWATQGSCSAETSYNYAALLKDLGKKEDARQVLEEVIRRRAITPGYLKRFERRWTLKAQLLLKRL